MDNVLETQGIPLTVFGGAVTEMAPEDLPEGASPFSQDVDYSPGSVFTRGGRLNQISYAGLSISKICNFAQNGGPPGTAWTSPLNATLGVPGTYASVSLNHQTVASNGISTFDVATTSFQNTVTSNSVSIGPLTPNFSNEVAFMASSIPLNATGGVFSPNAGWTAFGLALSNGYGPLVAQVFTSAAPISAGGTFSMAPLMSATCLATFRLAGPSLPTIIQQGGIFTGTWTGNQGPFSTFGATPVTAGNTLMVIFQSTEAAGTNPGVTDNLGNVYNQVAHISNSTNAGALQQTECAIFVAQNITGGVISFNTFNSGNSPTNAEYFVMELGAGAFGASTGNTAQVLQASNFNFSIPTGLSVMGAQIEIDGHQSTLASDTSISVTIGNPNSPATPTLSGQLPLADAAVTFGTKTTSWGLALTPTMLDSPLFQVNLSALATISDVTFSVYAIRLIVWLSPSPPANIDWIKTYEQTSSQVDTLILDSNGVLWDENVTSNPGVLNSIFLNILPNTYAKSITFDNIEYIAFSNLLNGTDIPRQWNSTNLDRISMVGPGAAPTAIGQTQNNTIVSITQAASTQIRRIAWGASANAINDSTPGNVLVIFGEGRTGSNTFASLPNAVVGGTIVLSGVPNPFPKKGGGSIPFNINGTYTVLSVTTAVVGGSEICPVFTVQAPGIAYGYSSDFGSGGPPPTSGWFYQATLATMTTQTQVPNLQVGGQFSITGTGGSPTAGYDGTWTVTTTPNAAQLQITSTQLNGGIATYSYTVITGSNPVVNEFITVTNTLNGGGIFNVQQVAITAASGSGGVGTGGSFSVGISGPNVTPAAENGSGIIFGTIFTFDPLVLVGNKTGGSVVSAGTIGVGIRKVCYSFLTRSGFITQPSPIAMFNVLGGSGQIVVSGLLVGPPNVVARIVHLTGANGGNFFNIPQPVTVISNGVPIVNSSTYVNDNTSTSVTLSFSDGVLLAGTAIDIPGNNLFADMELGSCRGLITYASRMIAWSEQNKIMNLRNLSFDGGIAGANQGGGVTTTFPAGWTVDPTNGGGVSLTSSPIFGFAVQIQNTSGITQATYGMLTQPAYLDEFLVPIVQSATTYSVRITASCPSGAAGGNLVVDLFSPSFNQAFGTFSVPLASMTPTMAIYTGTLLTTAFGQVPKDLLIRQYVTSIANNVTVQIDRDEPFPTLQPVFSVQMRGSYVGNQEAFDLVTGAFGPAQNQQPINGAFTMYDLLYALKERSWYSTSDNGVTEPNKWNWKEVSQKVGTVGILSYDYGEGWQLTANREGVFFFEGGEPLKISQEIQPLWDLINWSAGASIWLRNDPEQRRFTVGVPISTPNVYMPEFPANANPTSPNVIFMCNYRELNSGAAIASTGPIRATFSGRLMSPEPARKWSFWNIRCPYSDYIDRANNNWPQWFGTGYTDSKIFTVDAATLSDDGQAINSFYVTYGFVKPEMADAKGLGVFRMQFGYFTVLAVGSGNLNPYVYPESPLNPPYVLDQAPLPTVSAGDLELGVNIKGQRFFVRVGTNSVGSAWRVSKMVVALTPDSWSPVRGLTSAAL